MHNNYISKHHPEPSGKLASILLTLVSLFLFVALCAAFAHACDVQEFVK